MEKIAGFIFSAILLAACSKNHYSTAPGQDQSSIAGKWNVDTVTTYFYDSSGLLEMSVHGYPSGAPDYPYRFQFNNDYSLTESIHLAADSDYIVANATYTFTSDSTFTLIYGTAVSGKEIEPCKILLLTRTSFVFSKQLATFFNGTDPGYIKYVFNLTKF